MSACLCNLRFAAFASIGSMGSDAVDELIAFVLDILKAVVPALVPYA